MLPPNSSISYPVITNWNLSGLAWFLSNGPDLYLGTNVELVTAGDPSVHVGLLSVTNHVPVSPLIAGQTCFWRVHELHRSTRDTGNVWSFTVAPLNLLTNGGFELPLRQREQAGQWVTNAPIPAWTVTGSVSNLCVVYRPTVGNGMPVSTEEQQYVSLGTAGDTNWVDTILTQPVGVIQSNTRYTFEADVMPRSFSNSDGKLTLVADDGATNITVATGINWTSQSTGVWWHTSVTFDSATASQHVGKTLKAQIQNHRDAVIVDNAILSKK